MCTIILLAAYYMYVCAVTAVEDALNVMRKGAENRRIGETNMNRESSRSHSVFTCIMESSSKGAEDGCTRVKFSRLNLVDLAGKQLWPLLAVRFETPGSGNKRSVHWSWLWLPAQQHATG